MQMVDFFDLFSNSSVWITSIWDELIPYFFFYSHNWNCISGLEENLLVRTSPVNSCLEVASVTIGKDPVASGNVGIANDVIMLKDSRTQWCISLNTLVLISLKTSCNKVVNSEFFNGWITTTKLVDQEIKWRKDEKFHMLCSFAIIFHGNMKNTYLDQPKSNSD